MKKYLIKGLLALVVGGFAASCADKEGDYVPLDQQKSTAYAEVFKELIGGEVDPNHDWGFKQVSIVSETAGTRVAATNSNQWFDGVTEQFKHLVKPADVTAREEQVVSDWFKANQHPQSDPIYLSEFFVQQVYFGTQEYDGTDNNGHATSVVGGEHMDHLYAWDPTNNQLDHINNFNTSDPTREDPDQNGFHNMQLMQNSSTETFGFHESYNSQSDRYYSVKNKNWVIKALYVDGVLGYYVGFDYESHGNQGEFEPNGFFDDRIVKIVPGNGVYTYIPGGSSSTKTRTDRIERRRLVAQGRVFCEDLGTTKVTKSDIDFNDAVFDAKIWRVGQYDISYINGQYASETDYLENIYPNGLENGKFKYVAEICLLAAGGTVPLKIGGNNGFEIHNKFGEGNGRSIGHTTIINTMGEPSEQQFKALVNTDVCNAVTVEVDITYLVVGKSKIGLDIIPIDVQWVSDTHESVGELAANFGQTPQKLCVPIGTRWVYERIPITDAYGDFASYATSRNPDFWEGEKINPSLLYPSSPEGMTAEINVTDNVNYNPYYDRVVTTGTTTTEVESILWEGERVFAASPQGSSEPEITLYSKDFSVGDVMRIYGSASGSDPWVSIHAVETSGWVNYAGCVVTSPYSDITITQDMIDKMTIKVGLWGKDCTVTKICKVVTTTN